MTEAAQTAEAPAQTGRRSGGGRNAPAITDAQIQELAQAVTRAVRRDGRLYYSLLNLSNGTRGVHGISTQTGECEGLARVVEDLDRALVYVSRQTLFAKPEAVQARANAEKAVMEAAEKISDAMRLLVTSSNYPLERVRHRGLREAISPAETPPAPAAPAVGGR